jgi:hypothetical protein
LKRQVLIPAIFPLGLGGLVNVGARRFTPFVSATASYHSPLVPDLLSKERNVRHVFPQAGCSCPNHTASQWLDLAEGRLRLDRLAATAAQNFLPLGVPPIPREPRNFCAAVLRFAAAHRHPIAQARRGPRQGASPIASGLQIAIEAYAERYRRQSQGKPQLPKPDSA